jgi:hypothetical protein
MTLLHLFSRPLRQFLPTALAALVCLSCSSYEQTEGAEGIVVEGWIDSGRFPIVKVTRTVALNSKGMSSDSLDNYVEKWARVTVSDGERMVVLTGKPARQYYPPYIYTTGQMRGEVGKTYKLTVETPDGSRAEAETTIPEPVTIDSFSVERAAGSDTLCQLYGYTPCRQRCKVFTQVAGTDSEYLSAYHGLFDRDMIGSDGRISISRGRTNLVKDFSPFFSCGDTVLVKFSAIDSTAYRYWRDFEDMIVLSRNPLFPVTKNLHTNMKGALGYWFGYGSTFYQVRTGNNGK